jgi:hypothetical protein
VVDENVCVHQTDGKWVYLCSVSQMIASMAPAGWFTFLRLVSKFSNHKCCLPSSFECRSFLKKVHQRFASKTKFLNNHEKIFPPLPGAKQGDNKINIILQITKPGRVH